MEKLQKMSDKKTKPFKPMLITNDPITDDLPFPRLFSGKRHGMCAVIVNDKFQKEALKNKYPKFEEKDFIPQITGRSMLPISNIQFQEKFKSILEHCNQDNILLQGEIHMNGAISDDMVHFLNTIDLNDMSKTSLAHIDKNIAKGKFLLPKEKYMSFPDEIKIHVFDMVRMNDEGTEFDKEETYVSRYNRLIELCKKFPELLVAIPQHSVGTQKEEDVLFDHYMGLGYEGGVVRYDKGYKLGRSTPKEVLIYKRFPHQPLLDAKIIKINQAEEVNPDAPKTKDGLGNSVTSKKKEDRIPIEKARNFQVEMENEKTGKMMNFGCNMKSFTDEDKVEVWNNPEKYIGRWLSFECKQYSWVGRPKSASFMGFRKDKDVEER